MDKMPLIHLKSNFKAFSDIPAVQKLYFGLSTAQLKPYQPDKYSPVPRMEEK
jgi:hypothetical protein